MIIPFIPLYTVLSCLPTYTLHWNWNRVLEFGVAFSNLESYFLIRSGVLVFGVAFSNSELDVFELEVMFSNSEWCFRILFGVKFSNADWCFSNSECSFQIRSDVFKIGIDFWNLECHLEFRVHLWATVPGRTLCSPVRYFVINFI